MRSWFVKAHRYLALTMGLFFVFLGLTGAVLAFYPEVDRFINPHLDIQSRGGVENLGLVISNAKTVYPDKFTHSIFLASETHRFHQVWFTPSSSDFSQMWEVMVHPDTAEVIGHRQAVPVYEFTRENIVNTIYTLHLLMFFGPLSYLLLGILGIFLVLTLFIGVGLWWPTRKSLWLSVSIKRGAGSFRRVFDLHRVFGIYGFIVLIVIGISGTYLALPSQIDSVLGVQDKLINNELAQSKEVTTQDKTLDDVVSFASSQVGDQLKLKSVWMPNYTSNTWRITFLDPRHIASAGSDVVLTVDSISARVLGVSDYASHSGVEKFLRWQLPLHSGKVFGFWGRLLVLLSGFIPLVLFVTGIIIWKRKVSK